MKTDNALLPVESIHNDNALLPVESIHNDSVYLTGNHISELEEQYRVLKTNESNSIICIMQFKSHNNYHALINWTLAEGAVDCLYIVQSRIITIGRQTSQSAIYHFAAFIFSIVTQNQSILADCPEIWFQRFKPQLLLTRYNWSYLQVCHEAPRKENTEILTRTWCRKADNVTPFSPT